MDWDLVDTHAHLTEDRLRDGLDERLARAAAARVSQIIVVATTAADSRQAIALADPVAGLFPTAGIQPNHVQEMNAGDWETVEAIARSEPVVALGETGLDRYWDRSPFHRQQELFQKHLDLAAELDLPVIIHCRNCEADIQEQLGRMGRPVRGVLHSFTGSIADAQAFLALGLHVSYAGMITYPKAELDPLRETARHIPDDRLLIETDSPYLSPQPHRGKLNEPARLIHTLAVVAGARAEPEADVARMTSRNARALFGLPAGDSHKLAASQA